MYSKSVQPDCETPSNSIDSNACTLSSRKKVSKNFQLNNCKYKRQQKAEYRKQYRICTQSPQKKAKQNKYQRNYRTTQTSPQKKAKCSDYHRNYRLKNFKNTREKSKT